MKEFSAQTGGRYTYIDDIQNLQELALAFGQIFDDCDSFIISGCKVSGTSIEPGYVFINGKIRYFSGASGVTTFPCYIYENNRQESVAYKSGADNVGRIVYGCSYGVVIPTTPDIVTGNYPEYIRVSQDGGPLMKDVFFGKYSVVLDPTANSQEVNSNLKVTQTLTANAVHSTDGITIAKNNCNVSVGNNEKDFKVTYSINNGNSYALTMEDAGDIVFYINNNPKLSISQSSIKAAVPIISDKGTFGDINIEGSNIFNKIGVTDNAAINVNMLSGDTQLFRNTYIGNGKNTAIISVIGNSGLVNIDGVLSINTGSNTPLKLKSLKTKTDSTLKNIIGWYDNAEDNISFIGYNSTINKAFSIENNIGFVEIKGQDYVNIAPEIRENGVSLSNKYGLLSGGLSQFISGANTKDKLREQINAASKADIDTCVSKAKLLSDMASNTDDKQTICENIGAALTTQLVPLGTILMFSGTNIPEKYARCDGSAYKQSEYAELYRIIGSRYNKSDTRSDEFCVPDLRARFVVGQDSDEYSTLGKIGGEKLHTLTKEEMPSHTHTFKDIPEGTHHDWDGGGAVDRTCGTVNWSTVSSQPTSAVGSGAAHENRPPYFVLCYIIRLKY